jgi:hypothetical protein
VRRRKHTAVVRRCLFRQHDDLIVGVVDFVLVGREFLFEWRDFDGREHHAHLECAADSLRQRDTRDRHGHRAEFR